MTMPGGLQTNDVLGWYAARLSPGASAMASVEADLIAIYGV